MATKTTDPGRPPADDASRRAIAEELDTTMLVEAAAGTGKTTCLVGRMAALVATGRRPRREPVGRHVHDPRRGAAVAAIPERARAAARASEKDAGRKRNLDEALSALESCFVGTIHAFCARLLRERPVEAGVDPAFREMDEPEDHVAREEAWDRFVQSLFVTDDPVIPRLSALGVRLDDLREAYDEICENSDVEPAFGPGHSGAGLRPGAAPGRGLPRPGLGRLAGRGRSGGLDGIRERRSPRAAADRSARHESRAPSSFRSSRSSAGARPARRRPAR